MRLFFYLQVKFFQYLLTKTYLWLYNDYVKYFTKNKGFNIQLVRYAISINVIQLQLGKEIIENLVL